MKKIIKPRATGTIDPKEWNFKDVPQDEIEACYQFEYARELITQSRKLRFYIKEAEIHLPSTREWCEASDKISNLMDKCFPDFSIYYFNFLFTYTWQELSDSYRLKVTELISTGYDHYSKKWPQRNIRIQTLRELRPSNQATMEAFQKGCEDFLDDNDLTQTEYGMFAINWKNPDHKIQGGFNHWLSEQRKEREKLGLGKAEYKPEGRGGFRDRLNWLGAARIIRFYPKKQLVNYSDTNLLVDTPYSHLPDLYKNAKKADEIIKKMVERLDRS